MMLIERPAAFIHDRLGANVTLIYGDFEEGSDVPTSNCRCTGNLVLRSNIQLKGYSQENGTHARRIRLQDPMISTDIGTVLLLWEKGWTYSPDFSDRKMGSGDMFVFGIEEGQCFSYVASEALKAKLMLTNLCKFSEPDDTAFAHEGAHAATAGYLKEAGRKYGHIEALGRLDDGDKVRALGEALAMHHELGYVRAFHPTVEDAYHERHRSANKPGHVFGYKMATENAALVDEMTDWIKQQNLRAA